jgi:hypothetical protein
MTARDEKPPNWCCRQAESAIAVESTDEAYKWREKGEEGLISEPHSLPALSLMGLVSEPVLTPQLLPTKQLQFSITTLPDPIQGAVLFTC